MSDNSLEFFVPTSVAFGTIGQPGQRVFVFEVVDPGRIESFRLEKQQVRMLSTELATIIKNLARPGHLPDNAELTSQVVPERVLGNITLSVDEQSRRISLIAEAITNLDSPIGVLNVTLSLEQSASIAIQGATLVDTGRPPCPLCGYPIDVRGHICPKTNGNSAPLI